jgi:hypothetical protein
MEIKFFEIRYCPKLFFGGDQFWWNFTRSSFVRVITKNEKDDAETIARVFAFINFGHLSIMRKLQHYETKEDIIVPRYEVSRINDYDIDVGVELIKNSPYHYLICQAKYQHKKLEKETFVDIDILGYAPEYVRNRIPNSCPLG